MSDHNDLNRDEILDLLTQPEAGDEMAFRIDRATPDDGLTFSAEALEALSENVRSFTAARTLARWRQTGKAPTSMTARVVIEWDDDSDLTQGTPWWQVDDKGRTAIDGADRLKARS